MAPKSSPGGSRASRDPVAPCLLPRGLVCSTANVTEEQALSQDSSRPLITVVVAARNERARIEACLAGLRQDFLTGAVEVIVVDNASSDDTAALAAAQGATVVHEARVGIGCARNAGVRGARGELIAFLDADTVPEPRWLEELVAGADDPTVGCFVGEIVPLEPTSLVARYVHDRHLICQLNLLTRSPPAAATASVAYRRGVFTAIGLFDESLPGGEDSDLFWRLVRSDRFRIRYNPRAIVAHAHPSRVLEFARRSYREGVALGMFRQKHADDLPRSLTSLPMASVALARTVAGFALYPLRVGRYWRRERPPLVQALAYPALDKVSSTTRLAGVIRAHLPRSRRLWPRGIDPHAAVERAGAGGAPMSTPGAPAAVGAGIATTIDRLELDLEAAPLLSIAAPALRDRVCGEIRALTRGIESAFPGCSVVLTGSLFAGEGRVTETPAGPTLASDYDLFVVTPHPLHALPAIARRRLDAVMRTVGPRVGAADVGFVWLPLVRHRKTTLGGAVIGGSRALCALLPALPAPSAVGAMLQAYGHLTAAPLDPQRYAERAARALVRAARALLFADVAGRPRREWIALVSIDGVAERIGVWRPVLGTEVVDAIRAAGAFLLGRTAGGPRPEEHAFHCAILRGASARMRVDSKVIAAKQVVWMFGEGRGRRPASLGPRPVLEALQSLAESWPSEGPPRAEYASTQRSLARFATFNPHRFIYQPGGALS